MAGAEGLIPTTTRFGVALSDIVRCGTCTHMQLETIPAGGVLESAYAEAGSDDYLVEEAGQRETARRVLERVEQHRPPGDLLDLGCWIGFAMVEGRERGWRCQGVEPSLYASGVARERFGLEVATGELFGAVLPAASYDAVLLGDVIEHLPEPSAALGRIAALLRPGGVLAMLLPDAGSRVARVMGPRWWSVIPTHVQYFTRESMVTLLQRSGWRVLELATAPKAFTVRYYLERLEGYAPPVSRALVRAAELARVADRLWAPDFRDRMLVLATPEQPS